jgi:hypothetical protein
MNRNRYMITWIAADESQWLGSAPTLAEANEAIVTLAPRSAVRAIVKLGNRIIARRNLTCGEQIREGNHAQSLR